MAPSSTISSSTCSDASSTVQDLSGMTVADLLQRVQTMKVTTGDQQHSSRDIDELVTSFSKTFKLKEEASLELLNLMRNVSIGSSTTTTTNTGGNGNQGYHGNDSSSTTSNSRTNGSNYQHPQQAPHAPVPPSSTGTATATTGTSAMGGGFTTTNIDASSNSGTDETIDQRKQQRPPLSHSPRSAPASSSCWDASIGTAFPPHGDTTQKTDFNIDGERGRSPSATKCFYPFNKTGDNISNSKNNTRSRSKTRGGKSKSRTGIRSKSPHRSMSPFGRRQNRYQDLSSMEEDDILIGNSFSDSNNNNQSNLTDFTSRPQSQTNGSCVNFSSTSPSTSGYNNTSNVTSSPQAIFHDAHCSYESMERNNAESWTGGNSQGIDSKVPFQQHQHQHQQQMQNQHNPPCRADGHNGRPPLSSPRSAHNSIQTELQSGLSGLKISSLSPQKRDASNPIDPTHSSKRTETGDGGNTIPAGPQPTSRTHLRSNSQDGSNESMGDSVDAKRIVDVNISQVFGNFSIGTGNRSSPRKSTPSRGVPPRSSTPRSQQNVNFQATATTTTPNASTQADSPSILMTPLSDNGTPSPSIFSGGNPSSASSQFHFSSRLSMSGGSKGRDGAPELSPLHAVNFAGSNNNPFGSPPFKGSSIPSQGQAAFGRRQTAPPSMASGVTGTATAASQAVDMSIDATTPKNPTFGNPSSSKYAAPPKSVQTSHPKKKDRNTKTPIFESSTTGRPQPNVFGNDISPTFNIGQTNLDDHTKGRPGKQKPRYQTRASFRKTTSSVPTDIPKVSTDDTSPTASDMTNDSNWANNENNRSSPSNYSSGDMSIDTPFKSVQKTNDGLIPPPMASSIPNQESRHEGRPQPAGNASVPPNIHIFDTGNVGFSVGVGGPKSPSKGRSQKSGSRRAPKNLNGSVNRLSNSSNTSAADKTTNILAVIEARRELGKQAYKEQDYRKSIEIFTEAITEYLEKLPYLIKKDRLAVLYSNRAAALLAVGANLAAAEDSEEAIKYLSAPMTNGEDSDTTLLLRPKCYSRRGRAYLRLGRTEDATKAFEKATASVDAIFDSARRSSGIFRINESDEERLRETKTTAVLGMSEASRLEILTIEIKNIILKLPSMRRCSASNNIRGQLDNPKLTAGLEVLQKINDALKTASDSTELHINKIKLLASMKRWREVASHCERYAASKVRSDGCFVGKDLEHKAFFKNVPIAKTLKKDFFGSLEEDTLESANLVLSRLACGDAVLRLPESTMKTYIRALRLEERYECCFEALKSLKKAGVLYSWHASEYQKAEETRKEKDSGDRFFRQQEFVKAAAKYHNCSMIDFQGESDDFLIDGKNAGGRLHAVLHCNRAACFMALKQFHDALAECNWAIRIHPRYMKAILRKARCYSQLTRFDEAIAEYKHYLDLVEEAGKNPKFINPLFSTCLFDLPHNVSFDDKDRIKEQMNEAIKAKADAEEANRRTHYYNNQQKWRSERPYPKSDAQRRRDYFQSYQSSSRRWDSFNNTGPGRSNSSRQHSSGSSGGRGPQSQQKNSRGNRSNSSSDRNAGLSSSNDCHYSVLGVPSSATEAVIKKAYRKLALKYHPDKGGDPEVFKRISEANQILSDTTERRKYDRERRNGR